MLCNDCHVRVVDRHHPLSLSKSLHQSTDKALQSMYHQICVSFISRKHEKLLLAREIIIISRYNIPLSGRLRHDTQFINLVYRVMNYAVMLEL